MKQIICAFGVATVCACLASIALAQGQGPDHAAIVIPDSSIEQPGDRGMNAHTNHLIRVDPHFVGTAPAGETPASIAPVYNLTSQLAGAGVIVIVDAFHYPTALNDFNVFSRQFGLRQETSTNPLTPANQVLQVVYASGAQPRNNCGWAQEAALDIEWAHAMAPNAKIVLVEAKSNSFTDLFQAVDVANGIAGAKEVSMSWGGSEFSSEAANDGHFTTPGIVYFASSGDTGGVTIYPGVSPNVVSAGGTRINRDGAGNFLSETGWSGSGGGPSSFEARPAYQDAVGDRRHAPRRSRLLVRRRPEHRRLGVRQHEVPGLQRVARLRRHERLVAVACRHRQQRRQQHEQRGGTVAHLRQRQQRRLDDQRRELPRYPVGRGRRLHREDGLGFRDGDRKHERDHRQVTRCFQNQSGCRLALKRCPAEASGCRCPTNTSSTATV